MTASLPVRLTVLLATAIVSSTAGGQDKHPVEKYRRIPVANVTRISIDGTAGGAGASLERLINAAPQVRIGAEEEPVEQVFGAITDIAYSPSGELIFLDGRLNSISVFTADGRHVETFSGPGQGPGELRQPKALALMASGRLYVADAARRVHVFDRKATGFKFTRTATLPMDVSDMCEVQGVLVVLGNSFTDSTVLHRFDPELKLLGSFGVVYRSGDAMLDYQAGLGVLTCIPDQDAIVMTPLSLLGEVRSYSSSGTPRWVTRIDGMRPIGYELIPNGYRTMVPEDGFHRFLSIVRADATHVLVQVGTTTITSRKERRMFDALSTLRLRIDDGTGELISRDMPLLSRLDDREVVTTGDDPFPFVFVHRTGPGARR